MRLLKVNGVSVEQSLKKDVTSLLDINNSGAGPAYILAVSDPEGFALCGHSSGSKASSSSAAPATAPATSTAAAAAAGGASHTYVNVDDTPETVKEMGFGGGGMVWEGDESDEDDDAKTESMYGSKESSGNSNNGSSRGRADTSRTSTAEERAAELELENALLRQALALAQDGGGTPGSSLEASYGTTRAFAFVNKDTDPNSVDTPLTEKRHAKLAAGYQHVIPAGKPTAKEEEEEEEQAGGPTAAGSSKATNSVAEGVDAAAEAKAEADILALMNRNSLSGVFVDQMNDPDSAYNLVKAAGAAAASGVVRRRPTSGAAGPDKSKRVSGAYGFLAPGSDSKAASDGDSSPGPIAEEGDGEAYSTMSHVAEVVAAAASTTRMPPCPDKTLKEVLTAAAVYSSAWPKLHAEQIDDVPTLNSLGLSDLISIGLSESDVEAIQAQLRSSTSINTGASAGSQSASVAAGTMSGGGLRVKALIAGSLVDMANDPDSVYHTMPGDDGVDDEEEEFGGFDSDDTDL